MTSQEIGAMTTLQRDMEGLNGAPVNDRVCCIASKIKLLAYRTNMDVKERTGQIPINVSLFSKDEFAQALEAMKCAFRAGFCTSQLVALAPESERLGEVIVPIGKVGLATVSSITVSGVLLKTGIPLAPKFGGILEIRHHQPLRFTELIRYSGCSFDPAEIFVASKMTTVSEAAGTGNGKILANLFGTPAPCSPMLASVIDKLSKAGIDGLLMVGKMNEPVCKVSVGSNEVGVVLQSGLNPVAAAVEAGIQAINYAMSGVTECGRLRTVWELDSELGGDLSCGSC
jgi:repressor of nif and glnA expression